ncbi:hypothetical protein CDL12_24662 [Handroanthus impetiginosus]|uniref:MBD domain-containing protein n=1 Tax=Handroanthus impetiginosus TaxID=429701 RepID=A0A2G9GC10_9LAMI|nr:hypothetical protein CDL12_24662 [Handroanthus impetiginosus]
MCESELPNPVPQPQDPPEKLSGASEDAVPPDPLLESGSYIDPGSNDSGAEFSEHQQNEQNQNVKFKPGSVIAATPISMVAPSGGSPEAKPTPRPAARRSMEEMAKRPSWLPEDWKIDLKVRTSGATAGLIDRYYIEPSGQRKFRSKNEVLQFLETGGTPKRKLNSGADDTPSGSSGKQKQKKSRAKQEKSEVINLDP